MRAHVTWTEHTTDSDGQRSEIVEIRSPDLRRTEMLLPIWLRSTGRPDLAALPADELSARAPLTWVCSLAHSAARRQGLTGLTWEQWQETAEVESAEDTDPTDPPRPTPSDPEGG